MGFNTICKGRDRSLSFFYIEKLVKRKRWQIYGLDALLMQILTISCDTEDFIFKSEVVLQYLICVEIPIVLKFECPGLFNFTVCVDCIFFSLLTFHRYSFAMKWTYSQIIYSDHFYFCTCYAIPEFPISHSDINLVL